MVSAERSSMRIPPRGAQVRLAILDPSTAAQLEANLGPSSDLELAWTGTSVDALLHDRPAVQVVLVNINYLAADPVETINEVIDATGAELGIALYAYAKRELLERLSGARVRTLRSPLNIPTLRCQMLSIIARNLLAANSMTAGITPPRYSAEQLGKLQQVSTAIDCECPNHLSTLLQNLVEFEDYSAACESQGPADAALHRLLYEHTARARGLMERALDRVLAHEDIAI